MQRATKEDYVLSYHPEAAEHAVAGSGGMKKGAPMYTPSDLLDRIKTSLGEDKAEDIVSIDLAGKSSMADFMVVCSGRSTRQVSAISEKLTAKLKEELGVICKVEGKDQGDWVLIDAGDVIVHVFRPEVREFYQIEKMWMTPHAVADAKA